ncbi:3-hydroxyisobutyrate dehydrogenase [Legionella sainthelensi]|nr:3-hydroxyisobutyrate dehydrogenase [Legionella sainthelensi]
MAKIGFVGLGHMGLPMAINLIKAGHQVTGYDLQQTALQHFSQAGGLIAHNTQELAHDKEGTNYHAANWATSLRRLS